MQILQNHHSETVFSWDSGDPIVNLRLVSRKDRNKEYLLNLKIPTSDRNLDDLDEVETQAPGSEHGEEAGDPCRDLEEDEDDDEAFLPVDPWAMPPQFLDSSSTAQEEISGAQEEADEEEDPAVAEAADSFSALSVSDEAPAERERMEAEALAEEDAVEITADDLVVEERTPDGATGPGKEKVLADYHFFHMTKPLVCEVDLNDASPTASEDDVDFPSTYSEFSLFPISSQSQIHRGEVLLTPYGSGSSLAERSGSWQATFVMLLQPMYKWTNWRSKSIFESALQRNVVTTLAFAKTGLTLAEEQEYISRQAASAGATGGSNDVAGAEVSRRLEWKELFLEHDSTMQKKHCVSVNL